MDEQELDPNELVITSVRIPRAMRDELERHAPNHRFGRSSIIREAIERRLIELRQEAG